MRWLIRLVAVLFGLVALFLVALVLVPRDRLAELAARQFEAATGRAMTISGEVRPSVWPKLGVRTGPVTIANAPWAAGEPLLEARALEIGLDTLALMGGSWRISRVALDEPVIRLERDAEGRANWDLSRPAAADPAPEADPAPATAAGSAVSPFTLDEGIVTGGRVLWIDHGTGRRGDISGVQARVTLPESGGPADLTLSGQANGRGFAVEGRLEEAGSALAGRVAPLRLSLATGSARITFEGEAGSAPPMADGRIDAALGDLGDLAALFGRPRPELPEGLGRRQLDIAGRLTLAEGGTLHLRDGRVTADGNRLAVEADMTPGGDRPKLEANVRAEALELAGLSTPAAAAGPPGDDRQGWSRTPIDASALSAVDLGLALSAGSIDLGRLRLGATKAILTLDRARLVVDLREVAAYGGSLAGELVVNGRQGLSLAADLTLSGLQTEPLLADLAEFDRLATQGDVRLKLLAAGPHQEALMQSLSGTGSIRFGKGEFRGLDVARMVRTLDAGSVGEGTRTIFDKLGASFTVEKGVLRNEDLALEAPLMRATGAGSVGIGDRTLDYRLLPTLLPREDGTGGVSVPVIIAGPWAGPRTRLDLDALVRQPVGQQVKERMSEEAAERLGVVPQDGESLEEAAKRRARESLQNEAGRALNRLLGGN
ncbi:AsmA family protein [Cereibacter azotoformans]|uniref:AsmA protein n=1 Tax=Cereibacter azotoformans TaxID=43057 RepID=A0A2T5JYS3_9RHOB|nr:AsmA family protein [Cereibacter azotoformans]AXQ94491.1 AsmA family protein [Cereibacter sphaeroides]MBO4170674.1 AsmA family protein [Cereibacter azotoformans]PTR15322.1 AsmA protein [Cereibacter azotoformans]UIJ30039.1 AsmA family protein [Cereibacter azotoformans]